MGKKILIVTGLLLLVFCNVKAATIASDRIACVDIEEVFDSYAGTLNSRKLLSEEIRKRKEEIITLEAKISQLETGMNEGEEGIQDGSFPEGAAAVYKDTGTAAGEGAGTLEAMKKELQKKIQDIEAGLTEMDENMKYSIMGHIYDIIKEVAVREGYSIVINKEDMIYCEVESIDITGEVIRKLNEK